MTARQDARRAARRDRAYRTLLRTYPLWWRLRHGDVVLSTVREVHEAEGRRVPGFGERVSFGVDGARLALLTVVRPSTKAPRLPALRVPGHWFDQADGLLADRFVGEWEQARANRAAVRDSDEERVAAVAFAGMNAVGH